MTEINKSAQSQADHLIKLLKYDARIYELDQQMSRTFDSASGPMSGEVRQRYEDDEQARILAQGERQYVLDDINAGQGTLPLRRSLGRIARRMFRG